MLQRLRAWLARPYGIVTSCALCSGVVVGSIEDARHWAIDRAMAVLFPAGTAQQACLDTYFSTPAERVTGGYLIVVTDLANDPDQTQSRLVDRTLRRLYGVDPEGGIQLEAVPCVLYGTSGNAAARMQSARKMAADVARRSGAEVVIWGEVVSRDALIALSMTHAADTSEGDYAVSESRLAMDFAADLGALMAARILTLVTVTPEDTGTYLVPRMERVLSLTEPLTANLPEGLSPEDRRDLFSAQGLAAYLVGFQSRDPARLAESVAAWQEVVALTPREEAPQDWAAAQHGLGNALWAEADVGGGAEPLDRSILAFEAALQERPRDGDAGAWASTSQSLANAFATRAARAPQPGDLDRALAAYRDLLTFWTPEADPVLWADTQFNFGNALAQGEAGAPADDARLEQAIAAYRASLTVRAEDRLPMDFANSQNNLGLALATLGERRGDAAMLSDAVAALEASGRAIPREQMPGDWAWRRASLASALVALDAVAPDPDLPERAMAAYAEAIEVLTPLAPPQDLAILSGNLGIAQMRLAEGTDDADMATVALATLTAATADLDRLGEAEARDFFSAKRDAARDLQSRLGAPGP